MTPEGCYNESIWPWQENKYYSHGWFKNDICFCYTFDLTS